MHIHYFGSAQLLTTEVVIFNYKKVVFSIIFITIQIFFSGSTLMNAKKKRIDSILAVIKGDADSEGSIDILPKNKVCIIKILFYVIILILCFL